MPAQFNAQQALDALRQAQARSWQPQPPNRPQLPQTSPLPVMGKPSPQDMRVASQPLPVNPNAHWTSPEERSLMQSQQRAGNTPAALAGQRATAPAAPVGRGVPNRNQAMAEAYTSSLGLSPEAAGGSISEADLESAYDEMRRFPELIEMMKAQAPTAAAGISAEGNLAGEREVTRRALAVGEQSEAINRGTQQNFFDQLKQMGGAGQRPLANISVPGSGSVGFYNQPERALPAQASNALAASRAALEVEKGKWNNQAGVAAAQAKIDQQIGAIVAQYPGSARVKMAAQRILADPEADEYSTIDLLSAQTDEAGMELPEAEKLQLYNMLIAARGK